MRFGSLVIHGLSAIAISGELIAVRLMALFSGLLAILMILFGVELSTWFFATYSFLEWTALVTGVLIVFTIQALLSVLLFALIVLGRRSQARILPIKDSLGFIKSAVCLFPVDDDE